MRAIQVLDMLAGALGLAALQVMAGIAAREPDPQLVTRTMRLANGHIVHFPHEPLADCKKWQRQLARGELEVFASWSEWVRVTDVWCGTYHGEIG